MNVYFDIETIPAQNEMITDYVVKALSPPGNYKKQEAIDGWIIENKDKAIGKTSLDGTFGQVVCICAAINDGEVKRFYSHDWQTSEKKIIEEFYKFVLDHYQAHKDRLPTFIGHNIINFDLRFIFQRSIILGIKPLGCIPFDSKPYGNTHIYDTMTQWAGYRGYQSLDDVCIALGLPLKPDDIDGSKVWEFVKNGQIDRVVDYCVDDVEKVRAIYKRMNFIR